MLCKKKKKRKLSDTKNINSSSTHKLSKDFILKTDALLDLPKSYIIVLMYSRSSSESCIFFQCRSLNCFSTFIKFPPSYDLFV